MTALRIRDLSLPLTVHKRSMVDGQIDDDAEEDPKVTERKKPKPFLVQCRFMTPVRGVSALAIKATDRMPVIEMKQLVIASLHDLPPPQRPPDAILANYGSKYFQRQSLRNDFSANIATDPAQLLFFLDDDDECLADEVTLFELGYESAPLISVYCATDHLWLRIRGFPERYSVPWHLHMTECELAKEVYGVLRPYDMRLVRAVFYRDEEAVRRSRKWRRPATEPPPSWKSGSVFGAFETEDTFTEEYQDRHHHHRQQQHHQNQNDATKSTATTTRNKKTKPLPTCVVLPLHEWCRVPPPPNTKMDPAQVFEHLRQETAQLRCDMIREAFIQARDSWFEIPTDLEKFEKVDVALEHIPRFLYLTRSRDGREYVFRVELTSARHGTVFLETTKPLGEFAEAVLLHCASTDPTGGGGGGGGGGGTSPTASSSNSPTATLPSEKGNNLHHHRHHQDDDPHHEESLNNNDKRQQSQASASSTSSTHQRSGSADGGRRSPSSGIEQHHQQQSNEFSAASFQIELLSWEPQLIATGTILDNGEEEFVPHSHPQLFLPFDDDDEEVSPFGRKSIHTLWSPGEMIKRYPFLETDFFFHKRRTNASVPEMEEHLRKSVKAFLQEPLRYSTNPPDLGGGGGGGKNNKMMSSSSSVNDVEFDMESLPRHLSDYGIANGCEVFVEFFSAHTQQWSCDVAQEIHDRMSEHLAAVNAHQALLSRKSSRSRTGVSSISIGGAGGGGSQKNHFSSGLSPLDDDNSNNGRGGGYGGSTTTWHQQQRTPAAPIIDTSFSELPVSEQQVGPAGRRRNHLQISKRQRELAVRAAGFNFVNVRTSRGLLLRVPVVYEVATVQDLFDLVFCATGDVPMFSVMVGPQGELVAPWTHLTEVERNPGLLSLRILKRPRPWLSETVETVARAASRREPHLD